MNNLPSRYKAAEAVAMQLVASIAGSAGAALRSSDARLPALFDEGFARDPYLSPARSYRYLESAFRACYGAKGRRL